MKIPVEIKLSQDQQIEVRLSQDQQLELRLPQGQQIELKLSQDQQRDQNLLKEYELAQSAFYEIEKNVWQTASTFVVLSIGGVSILLTINEHSPENSIVVFGIGLVSIAIISAWSGIIERWWSLEDIALYRMREIEAEVGMWRLRYIQHLSVTQKHGGQHPAPPGEENRMAALRDFFKEHYAYTRVRSRIRFLVKLLVASWMGLIIRELWLLASGSIWGWLTFWFRELVN